MKKNNFETGKDYSISDIEALFEEKTSEGDFICNKEDIETEYVDLGCDGEYEYRVTLPYSKIGQNLEPPYQYNLKMLLKNIDGKLHIIFAYGYYWDSTTNKYSQSSDEYQTVQQFYENEGYIFLPDDEAYELKESIKKNAGLN